MSKPHFNQMLRMFSSYATEDGELYIEGDLLKIQEFIQNIFEGNGVMSFAKETMTMKNLLEDCIYEEIYFTDREVYCMNFSAQNGQLIRWRKLKLKGHVVSLELLGKLLKLEEISKDARGWLLGNNLGIT